MFTSQRDNIYIFLSSKQEYHLIEINQMQIEINNFGVLC